MVGGLPRATESMTRDLEGIDATRKGATFHLVREEPTTNGRVKRPGTQDPTDTVACKDTDRLVAMRAKIGLFSFASPANNCQPRQNPSELPPAWQIPHGTLTAPNTIQDTPTILGVPWLGVSDMVRIKPRLPSMIPLLSFTTYTPTATSDPPVVVGLRFDLTRHISRESGSNTTETSRTTPSHKLGLALSKALSGLTRISK